MLGRGERIRMQKSRKCSVLFSMAFRFEYTLHAKKDLDRLGNTVSKRILSKLDQYLQSQDPIKFAKRLSGPLQGFYRFRIGDYRVLFVKKPKGKIVILFILRIKHRKDIYE
jgi:mRNA interferase RelE/StbE